MSCRLQSYLYSALALRWEYLKYNVTESESFVTACAVQDISIQLERTVLVSTFTESSTAKGECKHNIIVYA